MGVRYNYAITRKQSKGLMATASAIHILVKTEKEALSILDGGLGIPPTCGNLAGGLLAPYTQSRFIKLQKTINSITQNIIFHLKNACFLLLALVEQVEPGVDSIDRIGLYASPSLSFLIPV